MRDFVEEPPESLEAAEPPEEDLLRMLEEREQQQASGWKHLNRTFSKLVLGGITLAAVVIMAVPATRDVVVSLAREIPRQFSEPSAAPVPLNGPAAPPQDDMMARAAALAAKSAGDNNVVDKKDIEFGMELLHFMQTPPKQDAPAAPAEPAGTPTAR